MAIIDKKQELENCNSVKSILMLIIVLYHSMIYFTGNSSWGPCERVVDAPLIGYVAEWLNSFHIYAFVLISGYIFCFIKYERGGYENFFSFLLNKAKRLLIPYMFIGLMWVVPINLYFFPDDNIFYLFFLGKAPRQLWFLLMLFWDFLICWICSPVFFRYPIRGAIIVGILYVIGLFTTDLFCINKGLQFSLLFYIGFMLYKSYKIKEIVYSIPSVVYLALDVAIFAFAKILGNNEHMLIKVAVLFLNTMGHCLGAVAAFVLLQRLVSHFELKLVQFLSSHSMTVFLVHQQLIFFTISWFNDIVSPFVLVLINFCFSLLVSTFFSVIMSKNKLTRFLVGSV